MIMVCNGLSLHVAISRNLFVFLFLVMPLFAAAQPEGYELFWHDEFDSTALDTSRWHHRGLGPRRGGTVTEEAVLLNGEGQLLITTTILDSSHYYVGMIGTQETFQTRYGYFECRARFGRKMPWDAFWLQSPTAYTYPPSENGAEIDIFEYYGDSLFYNNDTFIWISHNTFWGSEEGDGSLEHNGHKHLTLVHTEFHTVGVEWTPTFYRFYVDGKETFTSTEGISGKEEYIILSEEPRTWEGVKEELEKRGLELPVYDTFVVDYVRVYKKAPVLAEGLPAEGPLLEVPHPLPAGTSTELSFTLVRPGEVTIRVFDLRGRLMAEPCRGWRPRGTHRLLLDVSSFPAGLYLIRLTAPDGTAIRRMVVAR